MKKIFDDFTQCYSLSKTLRFSLIPQYETLHYIKQDGIIEKDRQKANDYVDVKPILDLAHKIFINTAISEYFYDWQELYDFF